MKKPNSSLLAIGAAEQLGEVMGGMMGGVMGGRVASTMGAKVGGTVAKYAVETASNASLSPTRVYNSVFKSTTTTTKSQIQVSSLVAKAKRKKM